jgi:hypothetical protein
VCCRTWPRRGNPRPQILRRRRYLERCAKTVISSVRELLYFEKVREDRGNYYVEYLPPVSNSPHAILNVVFPNSYELGFVANCMIKEVTDWLLRYPVPIMASAWDNVEERILPHGISDDGFLFGWFVPGSSSLSFSWQLEGLPPFFSDSNNLPDWRSIYKNIQFRTDTEVKSTAKQTLVERKKQNLLIKIVLVIWLAVIPATLAYVQFQYPIYYLEVLILLYSFWQAINNARKFFGHKKPSQTEKESAEKELKMGHYFYHCENNPVGFARLKIENFEREARERTLSEANALKNKINE